MATHGRFLLREDLAARTERFLNDYLDQRGDGGALPVPVHGLLARALRAQDRAAEAEQHLLELWRGLAEDAQEPRQAVASELAQHYEATQQATAAAEWRTRAGG